MNTNKSFWYYDVNGDIIIKNPGFNASKYVWSVGFKDSEFPELTYYLSKHFESERFMKPLDDSIKDFNNYCERLLSFRKKLYKRMDDKEFKDFMCLMHKDLCLIRKLWPKAECIGYFGGSAEWNNTDMLLTDDKKIIFFQETRYVVINEETGKKVLDSILEKYV